MSDLEKYFINNTGRYVEKWDRYFEIYERHFAKYVGTDVHVLEVGIKEGGSLDMWKYYFGPKATIYGVDINPDSLQLEKEDQIEIFIGDQEDREFLRKLAKTLPRIDILIDDGGHMSPQQINTFEELYPYISEEGVYMCEDLCCNYKEYFGGAYKKPGTFIEYSKDFIDAIHAWHWTPEENITNFTRSTHSLHWYDSILVIEKYPVSNMVEVKSGFRKITKSKSEF